MDDYYSRMGRLPNKERVWVEKKPFTMLYKGFFFETYKRCGLLFRSHTFPSLRPNTMYSTFAVKPTPRRRGAASQHVYDRHRQGLTTAPVPTIPRAGPSQPPPLFFPSQSQESIGEWPAGWVPPPGVGMSDPILSATDDMWDSTPASELFRSPLPILAPVPSRPVSAMSLMTASPALSQLRWPTPVPPPASRSPSLAPSVGPIRNKGSGRFRFSSAKYFLTYSQVSNDFFVWVCELIIFLDWGSR